MENRGRSGDRQAGYKFVQLQRSSIGVAFLLLIALEIWLSGSAQNVPVAVGQSIATRTPTAAGTAPGGGLKTRTPKPTRTPTPTQQGGSPSPTPTFTASSTFTPTPTYTDTPALTSTVTPMPTFTETAAPTYTATATPALTDTPTPVYTPSQTATATETGTLTSTVTSTVTATVAPTLTPSPTITGTLNLSVSPFESSVAPGGIVSFTVSIANTDTITATAVLTTTDSDTTLFTSSLQDDRFLLGPGRVAATVLTVSVSSAAQGQISDNTTIRAMIEGGEGTGAKSTVTTHLLYAQFNRAFEGLGTSDHFVSPDTSVQMHVGVSATAPLTSTVLTDYVPGVWSVTDTGGGVLTAVNSDLNKIEWNLKAIAAGTVVTRTYTLQSPPAANPPPEYSFQTLLSGSGQRFFGEPWSVVLQHPLALSHYRIGWDAPLDRMVYAAKADAAGPGIPRFKAFRVRFQVFNDQLVPVLWQPRLDWSNQVDGAFQPIVVGEPKLGDPFYIRPVDDVANGTRIPTMDFGTGWDTHAPQEGYVFTSQNPAPVLTLNPFSFTEIEFSVRATADAEYLQGYYFRLSDDPRLLTGPFGQIEMGAQPALHLTQPQYRGIVPNSTGKPQIKKKLAPNVNSANPHGPYKITGSECASCHRSHTGDSGSLLSDPPAQSNVCFTCHDGSNATANIKSQYTDPNVPPNDASKNSIYSHPATTPAAHPAGGNDDFHNVLNRQSECGDCHNSHSGDDSLATESANGYTASGALANISGVGVTGSLRTLTWKDSITYEYELCYKCHSSYTVLPAAPQETDQSAEFNPANASYHPIESAGKNTTITMTNSLSGTSPYKLWTYGTGDTIRCLNCHGDYRLADPSLHVPANARLAPHTSANMGILMNNYRDRVLKSRGKAYQASDFALCYQCHAEAPFVDGSGNSRDDTNFRFHGYHLNGIPDVGNGGTDINTPGDGQGNAICSECHYQSHGQDTSARGNATGAGLVKFAPDVQALSGGSLVWDPNAKTCILICHGVEHDGIGY